MRGVSEDNPTSEYVHRGSRLTTMIMYSQITELVCCIELRQHRTVLQVRPYNAIGLYRMRDCRAKKEKEKSILDRRLSKQCI